MLDKLPRVLIGACAGLVASLPAWSEPPAASGIVSRLLLEDAFAVGFYDPENDLTHALGIDIVDLCSSEPPATAIGDLSVQQALIDGRIVHGESAAGYAGVWQGNVLDDDFDVLCMNVLGTPPVAEGTVDYRYTDNYLNWIEECDETGTPNASANAWGYRWNGVLEDYFGRSTQYSGQFRAVWQECDASTFKERLHVQLKGYTN